MQINSTASSSPCMEGLFSKTTHPMQRWGKERQNEDPNRGTSIKVVPLSTDAAADCTWNTDHKIDNHIETQSRETKKNASR